MDAETASKIADRYIAKIGLAPHQALAAPGVEPRRRMLRPLPPPGSLKELTPLHKLCADYAVFGLSKPHAAFPELEVGAPLSYRQIAAVTGRRVRHIARLFAEPVFQSHRSALVHSMRNGEHAKSVHTMIKVRDNPGDGKAADRKVQLEAAKSIMGEEAKGININVGINNHLGVHIKPGYVVRMPSAKQPVTIEGTATEVADG